MEKTLKEIDPILADLIDLEIKRQQETINLIPSECLAPKALLEVLGSPLTNKYSEGEAGKRYYPGNEYCDKIENLAKQRAKEVFELGEEWEVNTQALSGAPANLAIYFGLLNPGDTIMGMALSAGGHLTHGHKVNVSGKIFHAVQYGVQANGRLDFTEIERLAKENRPKIIVSGFTAHPLKIDFAKFGQIAKEVGAWHLADVSHIAGLIAAKVHPSPFPFADVVMMTTHKTLNGPRGAIIFSKKEIAEKINRGVFPLLQGGPHNNNIAAIALCLEIAKTSEFKIIQEQIIKNAKTLSEDLLANGFELVGGGTENHLILAVLNNKGITGIEAQNLLEKAGIIANRNSVPGDQSPFNPSGLRMGAPPMTFRGMKEPEAKKIGEWINQVLCQKEEPAKIKREVKELCEKFPVPYL